MKIYVKSQYVKERVLNYDRPTENRETFGCPFLLEIKREDFQGLI